MAKNYIRGIFVLLAGLFLITSPTFAAELAVKVLGCLFIAAGIITIIYGLATDMFTHLKGMNLVSALSAVVFIVAGTLLLANPEFFLKFAAYLFGAILFVYGILQIIHTYRLTKNGNRTWSSFVVPVLVTALGIAFFCNPSIQIKVLTIIFGIALVLMGLAELLLDYKFTKLQKQLREVAKAEAAKIAEQEKSVEDIEPEEITTVK